MLSYHAHLYSSIEHGKASPAAAGRHAKARCNFAHCCNQHAMHAGGRRSCINCCAGGLNTLPTQGVLVEPTLQTDAVPTSPCSNDTRRAHGHTHPLAAQVPHSSPRQHQMTTAATLRSLCCAAILRAAAQHAACGRQPGSTTAGTTLVLSIKWCEGCALPGNRTGTKCRYTDSTCAHPRRLATTQRRLDTNRNPADQTQVLQLLTAHREQPTDGEAAKHIGLKTGSAHILQHSYECKLNFSSTTVCPGAPLRAQRSRAWGERPGPM